MVHFIMGTYYTKHSKNKKKDDDSTNLSRDNMGFKDDNSYVYYPERKLTTISVPTSTTSHENRTLKKKEATQILLSTNENIPPHTQDDGQSNLTFSKKRDTEISGNNIYSDADKVLQNKIPSTSEELTRKEKVNEFIRNLPENEFISSIDKSADESHFIEPIDESSIDLSSSSNSQSYWIDESFQDLNDIRSESSVGTLLPEQSDWCRACRKNPVNTHTEPCKHRYMCNDCATRIFRLYKRCKVCSRRIEEIILEAS